MSTAAANDSGELDELWSVPPEKFVEMRNAAAARARAKGDSAGAAAIKALKRPTPSAWLVNALVRSAAKEVEALFRAGDALITAQGRVLAGADPSEMHAAMRSLRDAISRAVKRARTILADNGRKPTTDLTRRVTATLRSASLDRRLRDVVLEARLSTDPGVDEVEALGELRVPARVAAPPKKAKVDTKARAREDLAAKKRADREAKERRAAEEREAKLQAAREARERLRAEVEAAEQAVDEARRALTVAEADERRAKAAAAEAVRAVEQAHHAWSLARDRLACAKKRAR